MKPLRIALLLCLISALAGVLYYFSAPRTAPAGQRSLVYLDTQNFAGLRDEFNAAHDGVRMIIMLSPT
jgi:hypothetical protein